MPVISVKNLYKDFKDLRVLDGVSLDIKKGEKIVFPAMFVVIGMLVIQTLLGVFKRVLIDSIGLRSNLPLNSIESTLNLVSTSSIAAE